MLHGRAFFLAYTWQCWNSYEMSTAVNLHTVVFTYTVKCWQKYRPTSEKDRSLHSVRLIVYRSTWEHTFFLTTEHAQDKDPFWNLGVNIDQHWQEQIHGRGQWQMSEGTWQGNSVECCVKEARTRLDRVWHQGYYQWSCVQDPRTTCLTDVKCGFCRHLENKNLRRLVERR